MKILFWSGLLLLVLGLASFVVDIPRNNRDGISVAGISMQVETTHNERMSPLLSGLLVAGGVAMMIVAKRKA